MSYKKLDVKYLTCNAGGFVLNLILDLHINKAVNLMGNISKYTPEIPSFTKNKRSFLGGFRPDTVALFMKITPKTNHSIRYQK